MRLVNIKERAVTLELSPEDCHALALGLRPDAHVSDNLELFLLLETMGAAFEAAALASGAYSHVLDGDEISLESLRSNEMLGNLSIFAAD